MNKSTNTSFWFQALVSIAVLGLVGCSTKYPMQAPNTAESYVHYAKRLNVHMEFDYPSSWSFYEKREFSDIVAISLEDPRFLILPTPAPPDYHPTPNDFGYIRIWIRDCKSGQTPETEVEVLKQNYGKNSHRYTVLDSYENTINGYKANVLEYYDNEPAENYPALMFNRRMFFMVKDQMYQIHFSVAEKERGGEFEQGSEYFFNSLEIKP